MTSTSITLSNISALDMQKFAKYALDNQIEPNTVITELLKEAETKTKLPYQVLVDAYDQVTDNIASYEQYIETLHSFNEFCDAYEDFAEADKTYPEFKEAFHKYAQMRQRAAQVGEKLLVAAQSKENPYRYAIVYKDF